MGLTFFSTRQAIPLESLNVPQPVIDSNSLREAALQASWHRDHRVAKRRERLRWVLFWGWKYGRAVGAILVPVVMAAWLAFQLKPGVFKPQVATALGQAPTQAEKPPVGPTIAQPSDAAIGIRLLPTTSLHTGTSTPSPVANLAPLSTWSQPLRLTPEIQSSPKEFSP